MLININTEDTINTTPIIFVLLEVKTITRLLIYNIVAKIEDPYIYDKSEPPPIPSRTTTMPKTENNMNKPKTQPIRVSI